METTTPNPTAFARSGVLLLAAFLLSACGDDGAAADPDMGTIAADMATATVDSGTPSESDAFVPGCDPATCSHGSCAGDVCECQPGWAGELCDTLDEPLEDGMAFWFDADAPETITREEDEPDHLDKWDSREGSMHVGPSLLARSPRVLTAGSSFANGRPTVTFDGADDKALGVWSASGATEYTVFAVFNALGSHETVVDVTTQLANGVFRLHLAGDPIEVRAEIEDADLATENLIATAGEASVGEMVVVALRVSDSDIVFWRDGSETDRIVLDTPLYPEGLSSPFVTFGSTDASLASTEHYGGSLAEVIAFESALTDDALEAVSAYLTAKWQ